MKFIRGIYWYPSFLKCTTSKKNILSLKSHDYNPPRTKNILFLKKYYFKSIVKFYVDDQGWSKMYVIEYFIYLNN